MMKASSGSVVLLLFTLFLAVSLDGAVSEGPEEVEAWLKPVSLQGEKMTKLHLYFHDLLRGKNVTSAVVARSNITSARFPFGVLYSADDPLTVGPELNSRRMGYLKGMYSPTSFEELDLIIAMAFVFTDGIYNGSSLSVLGHDPTHNLYREVPIVGGSGQFRLARGLVIFKTYYNDIRNVGNATVEVNIIVLHY